jgi:lysyl-tRNA synthetase class II
MLEDIIKERLKKKDNLTQAGYDSYPASVKRTHTISELLADWKKYNNKKKKITLVGRIFALRGQGGISFLDLKDENGAIQLVLSKDATKNRK